MQEILLGRTDYLFCPIRGGRDTFAHAECLARHLRWRLGPGTNAIDAEETKTQAVVLGSILAHEIAHDARHSGKDLFVARNELGIGGARHEQGAIADHGRALQLDGHPIGRLEGRTLHARPPPIDRAIGYLAKICSSGGLADFEGIGLLIEARSGDTRRCGSAARRHAFELEALVIENTEDGITPARYAAQRGALDDLGHMHGDTGREIEQRRDAREYARVAG